MRGADPAIVLIPGVGMFSYGKDKQTARVAGEFYLNAINVMRGAEAISRVPAHRRVREVPHRVLGSGRGQARADAQAETAGHPHRSGHRRGIGHRQGHRDAAGRRGRLRGDRRPRRRKGAVLQPRRSATPTSPSGIAADVTDEAAVQAAVDATVLAFGGIDIVVNNAGLSLSKSLLETTAADWDLQHNVMARGSFLVSRAAAKALIDQKLGGDIIYISSKNSVFAGPNNIAYSATKADQAHQVRLLAAELGEHGIKVNGINPDGVVRGSGIFAGGWGAKRAAVYGVPEEELGPYYAQRTLLKREVLPENIANAAFALCTRTSPTPPACTCRSTPASRPRSCDDRAAPASSPPWTSAPPAGGSCSPRSGPKHARHPAGGPVRQRSGLAVERPSGPRCTGTCPGCFTTCCSGLAEALRQAPDLIGIGVDSWAVDYGLLRNGAARGPAPPLPRRPACDGGRRHRAREDIAAGAVCPQRITVPAVQHRLPAGRRRARRALEVADRALLVPDLIGYWLTGRGGHRAHQRLHHRAAGRSTGDWDDGADGHCSACPPGCFPPSWTPGPIWARCCPDLAIEGGPDRSAARQRRRIARHRLGGGRRPDGRPESAVYISCGTWGLVGVELDRPGRDRGGQVGQLHQRGRRRRANPVPAQRDGHCGCSASRSGTGSVTARRIDLAELLEQAAACPPPTTVFDTDDPRS